MLLGTILTLVGGIGAFLTGIIIMVHAFKKSVAWGVYSLIPGAISIYAILHFSEVKKPFLFSILFTVYFFIG